MFLQSPGQFDDSREGDIEPAVFDLGDLAVVQAAIGGYLAKGEPFLFSDLLNGRSEFLFEDLFFCADHSRCCFKVNLTENILSQGAA